MPKSPAQEMIFCGARPPLEKHHEHHFAQYLLKICPGILSRGHFFWGCLGQNKGAHYEHQQGFGGCKTSYERAPCQKSGLQNVLPVE